MLSPYNFAKTSLEYFHHNSKTKSHFHVKPLKLSCLHPRSILYRSIPFFVSNSKKLCRKSIKIHCDLRAVHLRPIPHWSIPVFISKFRAEIKKIRKSNLYYSNFTFIQNHHNEQQKTQYNSYPIHIMTLTTTIINNHNS